MRLFLKSRTHFNTTLTQLGFQFVRSSDSLSLSWKKCDIWDKSCVVSQEIISDQLQLQNSLSEFKEIIVTLIADSSNSLQSLVLEIDIS